MATDLEDGVGQETCPACAGAVAIGSAVCIHCGTVMREGDLTLTRCSCGSIIMSWQNFCMRCGTAVGERSPVGPVVAPVRDSIRPSLPPMPRTTGAGAAPPLDVERGSGPDPLEAIRGFVLSRRGAAIGALLMLLAVAPWFFGGNQVIVRLLVPAGGTVVEKSAGQMVYVDVLVLNAGPGSSVQVMVDGVPLNAFEVGDPASSPWTASGPVGSRHVFTAEVRSEDGDTVASSEPATVVLVG